MDGVDGQDGQDGQDGAPGRDGADGADGAPGAAATIAVGTVTGLPAGSTPTVTNSGTSAAAVFNFGIPAGADGQDGQDGRDGVGIPTGGTVGQILTKQSADDYDVAWEDIGWTKVWENASPSSAFAAQTVTLGGSYTEYLIYFKQSRTIVEDEDNSYVYARAGDNGVKMFAMYNARTVRYVSLSSNSVTFSGGVSASRSADMSADNNASFPLAIYAR